ncbi:endonuclease/exonuclease/phosphatase family protein [Clostridium sp.]|uniref:endonuclease/exonuclease/phosphatase family protein n=1 Tax=Clostridium sp. TaxID=1506 RepID=UPI003216E4EE
MVKKISKIVITIILAIIILAAGYIVFMIITDYKPEEKISVDIENNKDKIIKANTETSITTFNIGYGTMDEFVDFFMDGGIMSRGSSKEKALENLDGIESIIENLNSDLVFLQEVDVKATRSFKIDQLQRIKNKFTDYSSNFAINYKSPWVPIPLSKPHGQVLAGLTTLSKFNITSSTRYDLPGKSSFLVQLGDLDRAMVVNRLPVDNGKELIAINAHLSAYDEGGLIRKVQLGYIKTLLEEEYAKGNYVIIGGDWNQQIPGTNALDFPTTEEWPDWLQDIPKDFVPSGYTWAYDKTIATSRTVATPYTKGENLLSIIDGFLVSDNVGVISTTGTNAEFKYSDHNPVTVKFKLK